MHLVRRDTELDPAFLGGSLGERDTRERGTVKTQAGMLA
jgi:hypothetical protein